VNKSFLLLVIVMLVQFYAEAEDPGVAAQSPNAALVEVNGQKLVLADLDRKHPGALFQARNSYYEAEKKVIEQFVDEYLLEQQAKKEDLTVAQLLERHVNTTIAKDPSEESLRVYYEGVETTEPYETVRGKIVDALHQRRIAKARAAYLQTLRSEAKVVLRVSPPRAEISLKDTPVRGEPTARVKVVEYADYECAYCQQVQPALEKLEAEFRGKVVFAYKDYPLPMHAGAEKAAEAAHCAEAEGKYWEYHDVLFAKKQLDLGALKGFARDLKLDAGAFDKCLDSGAKAAAVRVHAVEAQSLGLQGTPTIFINGRYFSGALSYEALRDVVQEELSELPAPQVARR
jgi:protein-disulfide isomerase